MYPRLQLTCKLLVYGSVLSHKVAVEAEQLKSYRIGGRAQSPTQAGGTLIMAHSHSSYGDTNELNEASSFVRTPHELGLRYVSQRDKDHVEDAGVTKLTEQWMM